MYKRQRLHQFGLTRSTNTRDDLDVRSAIQFNDSIEIFCSLFASAKSNQKQTGRRPATSIQVEYLLKHKLCAYQKIFVGNRRFVPYSSEYFEPVRKGSCGIDAESGFAENQSCSACLPPQAVI